MLRPPQAGETSEEVHRPFAEFTLNKILHSLRSFRMTKSEELRVTTERPYSPVRGRRGLNSHVLRYQWEDTFKGGQYLALPESKGERWLRRT